MTPLGQVRRAWQGVRSSATGLLFPPTCCVTGEPISAADYGLSRSVREHLAHSLAWPYCTRCGATLGPHTDAAGGCLRCAVRKLGLASLARAGTFDPPLSQLIWQLKFGKRWELAPLLAPLLKQAIERQTEGHVPVDALVPVPLHWYRYWTRGFNQAEELAVAAARLAGWRVVHALQRAKATLEQSQTDSVPQRMANMRKAFRARTIDLSGLHVWLIDDVCTTGATLHAAAVALRRLPKRCRPKAIHAAVLAVTDHTPIPALELDADETT